MPTVPREELEIRRIVLLRLEGGVREVFLRCESTGLILPQVLVARAERVAPQLAAQIQQTCGVKAVSVFSLEAEYELMEVCERPAQVPKDSRWVAIGSLVESSFSDRYDFQVVQTMFAQSSTENSNKFRGPFAYLDWFGDLRRWVEREIRAYGLHLTGEFNQLNACPTFSLIRLETDGPAVWFKAVGKPNLREYALTLALSQSCSAFLPSILGSHAEWNGWLTREVEGSLLDANSVSIAWEAVARDLAALQIHSLGRALPLLDLDARDLRVSALANRAEPFFEAMREVFEQQTKIQPPRLSRHELRHLSVRVLDALAVLDGTKFPDALGHLDLNPGNIVCSSGGSKFLDWAEGFVGHPFLTFEYLGEHFRHTFGGENPEQSRLLTCYLFPWRTLIAEREILCALKASPLVAVFAAGVSSDVWTNRRKLGEPRAAGYLRSLVRRMQREANAFQDRSLTCLN